jgi:phage terminase small subunit
MQRGVKPTPSADKVKRGTLQPCREEDRIQVVVPQDLPRMPEYLDAEAQCVWEEDLGRAMSAGVVEVDSSEFAAYCALEASVRKAYTAGEVPPTAALVEARRKRELFGIAGPKSRIKSAPARESKNPFARNV